MFSLKRLKFKIFKRFTTKRKTILEAIAEQMFETVFKSNIDSKPLSGKDIGVVIELFRQLSAAEVSKRCIATEKELEDLKTTLTKI